MAIFLDDLLADPALGLVLEGAGSPPAHLEQVPIQWIAVTELEDPRPFLGGAEVVLTTGARLTTPAAQRAFVQRAHEAGALAIGFGVGLTFPEVPGDLLDAADDVGLPTFRVPYEVPFIAIGKKVADALSADHYAGLEDLLRSHATLAETLLGRGGLDALLGELARMLATDVVLHQYGARIAGAAGVADGASVPGGAARPTDWHRVPIATGLKDRCTLAIAEPYAPSAVLAYAQGLISVELTNQARNRTGTRTAAGQVLEDVVRGALAGAEATVRLASLGIDTSVPHEVMIVDVASGQRRALRTLPLPDRLSTTFAALVDERLVLVLPPGSGAAEALSRYLHGAGLTARIGVGGAYVQPNGVRWSYFEAAEALQRGEPVNVAERLSLTSLLMSSAAPLADLAAETLEPLETFDETHGTGLLTTLRRYLELDGSIAAVAADLSLHRNTVRYRLQQVRALTGYDAAVTADRVHLYLALRVWAPR